MRYFWVPTFAMISSLLVAGLVAGTAHAFMEGEWSGRIRCTLQRNEAPAATITTRGRISMVLRPSAASPVECCGERGTAEFATDPADLIQISSQYFTNHYPVSIFQYFATLEQAAGKSGVASFSAPSGSYYLSGAQASLTVAGPKGSMRLTLAHSDFWSISQTCTATLKRLSPSLPAQAHRFMFVTSSAYRGDLGGLSGADGKCQQAASWSALPPGIYKAWLSDAFTSAASRLVHWNGPIVLPNGTVVAKDWNDLTDGILDTAPIIDQTGHDVTGAYGPGEVWTNATITGGIGTAECGRWSTTVPGTKGAAGFYGTILSGWTAWNPYLDCISFARLYCLQQ